MSRAASASTLSFDDHVAQALALVADGRWRPEHAADRPPTTRRALTLVPPLKTRTTKDGQARR